MAVNCRCDAPESIHLQQRLQGLRCDAVMSGPSALLSPQSDPGSRGAVQFDRGRRPADLQIGGALGCKNRSGRCPRGRMPIQANIDVGI